MKENRTHHEADSGIALQQVKKMTEKEGAKGWTLAKETLLDHKTSSPQLQDAINHLVTSHPDYFRPAVVSLCSKAVGGTQEVTIPSSASLVLLAKAIGIHDDIIDQSKTRNKRPTLLGKFGKDIAIIMSDILLFKGFTLLRKNVEFGVPERTIVEILDIMDSVWYEQSESEIMEVKSRREFDVTPEECLAKIRMRSSETEAATRIGGILGNGSEKEIEALGKYGRLLGTASILRDELIDLLELDVLKHRIRKESLPLPIIYAIQNTETRSKIVPLLSKKRLKTRDLLEISKASDMAEGIRYVADLISETVKEACLNIEMFKNRNTELTLLAYSLHIRPEEWKPVLQTT